MQPEADRVPGGGLTNCGNQNATARFSGHNAPLALLQSPDDSPAQLRAGRAIFRPDRPRHERNLHAAWVLASRVVSFECAAIGQVKAQLTGTEIKVWRSHLPLS